LHHTRIQDLDSLLTDQVLNSEFGDLTSFLSPEDPDIPSNDPSPVHLSEPTDSLPQDSPYIDIPDTISPPENPGIWLINLAVLAAATRLRVDPWRTTEGYIQFIALHHWHPSFGLAFPSFLQLVQTELQDSRLHTDPDGNPFDIQQA
jgi:hypothetical protein